VTVELPVHEVEPDQVPEYVHPSESDISPLVTHDLCQDSPSKSIFDSLDTCQLYHPPLATASLRWEPVILDLFIFLHYFQIDHHTKPKTHNVFRLRICSS
jgi:hypothetical protein